MQFSSSQPKAVIAVPSIHPGPFKNIGSSLLPSMLKNALEKKFGCVVCVPHGLFGHEFDLASQSQTQTVIDQIAKVATFRDHNTKATPFTKVSNESAAACCQVFGNFAFISFTLAPKTTEDLPQELGMFIQKESQMHKLVDAVVVNAHNSIDGTASMEESLIVLKKVGAGCLDKVASMEQLPFEVGAATTIPEEFSLKQGMGPGGLTAVVVKVGQQKTAYVVIDGNNMVSGLREKILLALNLMGISDGEVFTTDTHSVNALILGNRGYHPIGEVISHEVLIEYIKRIVSTAVSGLEPVKAACSNITVPNVKVIGERQLEMLCILIDKTLQKAKKAIIPILGFSGLLLMSILMFV
jgi:putative membrane protein